MSSFLINNKKIIEPTDLFLRRGKDLTKKQINNTHILHCKSDDHSGIFVGKNGFVVSNGFCYSPGFEQIANSLTENPLDLVEILNYTNGDYSLFAETDSYYAIVTDPWKTKHIWVCVEDNTVCVSSTPDVLRKHYQSAYPVDPNTVIIISKKDLKISKYSTKTWNLTQYVNNHSRVFDAIENSVKRRYDKNSIATLSSGYDSGTICCALHNVGFKKFSISYKASEDYNILRDRMKIHGGKILPITGKMSEKEVSDLKSLYLQAHVFSPTGESIARICKHMIKTKKTNILTGNGGDELYTDYGYLGDQLGDKSLFGGKFPSNLELIWPWHDYLNRQSKLVSRLDLVTGYYGIQHKEPLLDIELVQTWLNTTAELKNRRYKNWMYEYMMEHNYPVLVDIKIGFGNNPRSLEE